MHFLVAAVKLIRASLAVIIATCRKCKVDSDGLLATVRRIVTDIITGVSASVVLRVLEAVLKPMRKSVGPVNAVFSPSIQKVIVSAIESTLEREL